MNQLIDLDVSRVDLVDEGANSHAHIMLYKRKETQDMSMTYEEILKGLKPEHVATIVEEIAKAKAIVPEEVATELKGVKKSLKDAEAALNEANETISKAKPTEEPDFEEVLKGMDPAMQTIFKRMQAEKEAAEEIAKAAADKQLNDSAIAKAATLKNLPVEQDKLVEVVKGIKPELYDILKAANDAIDGSGLLDEVGNGAEDTVEKAGNADQAWALLEKKAGEIAVEKGITANEAMSIAIKKNRDLYKQSLGGAN